MLANGLMLVTLLLLACLPQS
eukprot:COSAG02_NODE_31500_length_532_cov_1.311778_1_plen_20_part_10